MVQLIPPLLAAVGLGGSELLIIAVLFAAFGFWLWMLVDCLQNEKDAGTKIAWLLVIILVAAVGVPLYFFMRKLPRKRGAA